MRRLFEAAGVDFVQWRALMRAYVWMDYGSLFGANGSKEAWQATRQFVVMSGFMSLVGLGLGAVVWGARDPFFAAVLVVTSLMFWAGLMVVAQPASLASPIDHEIVAPRPVTSRTYFAVRFSSLLLSIVETTVLMGWLPVLAFLTRNGGSLALALAAAGAILASVLAATAGIVAIYGWLIRLVPPARLTRILASAGAALSLALTAGVTLGIMGMLEHERPFDFLKTTLPRDLRTYWFPGSWFASYVTVAHGTAGGTDFAAAAASGLMLVVFASALRGRMSLDYAARVNALSTIGTSQRRPWFERTVFFRRGEARAVGILIASHLRSDSRFQLAVASNAMMGIVIVLGQSGFRLPVDPFLVTGNERIGGLTMPLVALVMVPMQVYQTIAASVAHEASWLYFTTPADRPRIITSARDAIAVYVLGPLLLLLCAFYIYSFGHVGHAAVHCVFLGLLAYLSLQLTVLIAPRLPFSLPLLNGRQGAFPIGTMLLLMLVMMPLSLVLQHFAYRSGLAMSLALGLLAVLSLGLNAVTRRRRLIPRAE